MLFQMQRKTATQNFKEHEKSVKHDTTNKSQ